MKLTRKETIVSYNITDMTPKELSIIEDALNRADMDSGFYRSVMHTPSGFKTLLKSLMEQK